MMTQDRYPKIGAFSLSLCFFSQDPVFHFKNTWEIEIALEQANSCSHKIAAEAWSQGKLVW